MIPVRTRPSAAEILDVEFSFTRAYQRYSGAHPAVREAHCLAEQFPAVCLPPAADDLFVGRVRYRGVGFSPQFRHALDPYRKRETVGYYCEPQLIYSRLDEYGLEPDDAVEELLAFWQGQTTFDRLKARFTPEMRRSLPTDNWSQEPAVAFPLYRMAGATMDFDKLLTLGLPGLRQEIELQLDNAAGKTADLYTGMLLAINTVCDSAHHYVRFLDANREQERDSSRQAQLSEMARTLINITEAAPRTLREAIQLMILYSMHANLYANYGRMDVYFGDFYVNDIAAGRMTEDEAADLLLSLWRMFPSYHGNPTGEAETRVFIGGKGRRNELNADRFALLAMEVTRRHHQPYPQLSLRLYEGMNPKLNERALDLLGQGLTYPILYNDDVNIPAIMTAFEITETLAEQYTPYSCGEYVMQSSSFGTPSAIINLPSALNVTLRNGREPLSGRNVGLSLGALTDFDTFEELFTAYTGQVEHFTRLAADVQKLEYEVVSEDASFLYFSMLYNDCIGRGKAIFDGGIRHLGGTYETYGNVTTADSLTAIKSLVYEQKTIARQTLLAALEADFDGYEDVRQQLLAAPKFGCDDDVADSMVQRVHNHVCHFTRDQAARVGLDSYLVVIINNVANVVLGRNTAASPDGRQAGKAMTNGYTASNGMEKNGITALFNSILKLNPNCHAGAVHNLKFSPRLFNEHRPQLEALLDTYFEQGGTQAMITVVSREDLLHAVEEPEKYGHLLVRTGGFSARFVELAPDVQQEIIERTLW